LAQARAPAGPAGRQADSTRRSGGRRERIGAVVARRGKGLVAVKFLVFIEQREGKVRKASLEALSLARRLSGGPVTAVLAGKGVAPLAKDLGKYGAGVVYVADQPDLA